MRRFFLLVSLLPALVIAGCSIGGTPDAALHSVKAHCVRMDRNTRCTEGRVLTDSFTLGNTTVRHHGLESNAPFGTSEASTETIVGSATITGAPKGWIPDNFYTFFCPTSEAFSISCKQQVSGNPNQRTGEYSTKLQARTWKLGMYYYTANGQIITSGPVPIPDEPGATIHASVSMAYVVPAVTGTVAITGAPKDLGDLAYMGVQACPGRGKFTLACPGLEEAYEDVGPGTTYLIDLSPGRWSVADYYTTDNNQHTFAGTPVQFAAKKGITVHINVTMRFQGLG